MKKIYSSEAEFQSELKKLQDKAVFKTVDLREVSSKDELHDQLIKDLNLPDYYGKNLDALDECLADVITHSKALFIQVLGLESLKQKIGEYAVSLEGTFRDQGAIADGSEYHLLIS